MGITLYHCHQARSMRSLWLLHELGLEFDLHIMPFGRELRDPAYLAVHPLGRVPCLQDGDVILFETGAIAQYLCETYDDGRFGRAPGHAERFEWLQWLHYGETIAVHAAVMVQQYIVIATPEDRSALIQKLEARRLEKALEVVDQHLNGQDYMLKSGFTAADIAIGYSVYAASYFIDLAHYPALDAWFKRITARPAFQKSIPAADEPLKFLHEGVDYRGVQAC